MTTGPTFDITLHSEKDPDLHPGRDLSSADFAAEHTSGTPRVFRDKCSPLWTHKAASLHFPSSKKHRSDPGAENSENSHLGCCVLSDSAKEIFNVRARQMIKLVHKISVCVSVCLSPSVHPNICLYIYPSLCYVLPEHLSSA